MLEAIVFGLASFGVVIGAELWALHEHRSRVHAERERARRLTEFPRIVQHSDGSYDLASPSEDTRPQTPLRRSRS